MLLLNCSEKGPHGFFHSFGHVVAFVADKLDIGYRRRVVELQGIGVQAQETHVAGSKGEIFRAEYLAEHVESRSQTVMVA